MPSALLSFGKTLGLDAAGKQFASPSIGLHPSPGREMIGRDVACVVLTQHQTCRSPASTLEDKTLAKVTHNYLQDW